MFNLVTRIDVPAKLTLEQYRKLPVGSEIVVWDKAPHDFLDKDLMFVIARERQYKIRKVDRHWLRDHIRVK